MATRHNACINPALDNDATGWGGETTPTRQAVTGFDRPFAAQYTTGTFLRTAGGAVTPGLSYALSVYVRPSNAFSAGGNIYIEWRDVANGVISFSQSTYTLTSGIVSRASFAATAPSGAATAALILDGANYVVTLLDATMALVEQTAALDDYFDGNSSGGSWDGTPGNSPSTLTDAAVVTASGPAGGSWLRAGSGAVSVSNRPAGTAGKTRLSGGAGALLAVRRAPLAGTSGAIRLRPGAGAVNAAQPVPALLSGRSGRIVGWAAPGVVATVREAPCRGRGGVLLVRAGRGEITGAIPEAPPGPGSMTARVRRTSEMTVRGHTAPGMRAR